MATGRSFAEYVKDKCYNGLYEAAEKYAADNQDTLDLRTRHVRPLSELIVELIKTM